MARASANDVAKIIEVDSNITDLSPFINAANELVTELLVGKGYSTARLKMIETWLAAHFYAIRDPRRTYEQAGPVSERVTSKVDLHLNLTWYGQQAMILDTSGELAALNKNTGAGRSGSGRISWLGKKRDDKETYWE